MRTLLTPAWLVYSVLLPVAAVAQDRLDSQLLAFISRIRAVDNHSHALPPPSSTGRVASPADPLGTSPPFFSVRQRESNPEWIEAWRALYGYPYRDASAEHVREAFSAKQRVRQEKGSDYPGWILDQSGIEFALINAPSLGPCQTEPRFRWVPYADGFLFPFPMTDFVGNPPQRRREEVGLDQAPPPWADYLASVSTRLREWRAKGAVAIKFTIAYYRSLDFARTTEADAKNVYDRYLLDGDAQPRDYRTSEYKHFRTFCSGTSCGRPDAPGLRYTFTRARAGVRSSELPDPIRCCWSRS